MEGQPLQPVRLRGERLSALRERHRLTQEEVATVVGMTRSYLSRLEHGRYTSVQLDIAGRLAALYGVSLDYLTGRTDVEAVNTDGELWTADAGLGRAIAVSAG